MIFVVASIFGIFGLIFLWAYISVLVNYTQDKKRGYKGYKPMGGMLALALTLIILCITLLTAAFNDGRYKRNNYKTNSNKSDTKTLYCNMCGGEIKCAICGDINALYCEWASYGAGNDHYCKKHWPDVVEWHEKK